ncbi:hypothetical protein [Bilophila wadsworthia]|mgnify:FL=1|jgi:hypothetical protein|uniref:hypothetical protein n=1 Tax=Bilophila wadsworthia TaxID=35833 RepID=UPI00241FCB71|nr:hypothetical protein [Bilophila wadsworthia]
MDFTISEEILKIAFPALCGIGGVVVGAVLKSWFDWKLESKKAEQQRKLASYAKQREVIESICCFLYDTIFTLMHISQNINIYKEDRKNLRKNTIETLNNILIDGPKLIHKNIIYLPGTLERHLYDIMFDLTMIAEKIIPLIEHTKERDFERRELRVIRRLIETLSSNIGIVYKISCLLVGWSDAELRKMEKLVIKIKQKETEKLQKE